MRIILLTTFWLTLTYSLTFAQGNRDSLVLYLNFNGASLVDLSRNGHQIIGHNAAFDRGIESEGLSLTEENESFLEVTHTSALEITETLTTSLWYKHIDQTSTSFYSLVEQSANEFGGHSRYGTWVHQSNQLLTCIEPDICPNGGQLCQRCIGAITRLEEGRWYHIVSTYDGQSLKIYINGQLDFQRNFGDHTGISIRSVPLTIGTDVFDGSPLYLTGILDEIKIFDEALGEDEILALYDEFQLVNTQSFTIQEEVSIFPNPATDMIQIQTVHPIQQVTIYDIMGQLQHSHPTHQTAINLTTLSNGYYIVLIESLQGNSRHPLIIKR